MISSRLIFMLFQIIHHCTTLVNSDNRNNNYTKLTDTSVFINLMKHLHLSTKMIILTTEEDEKISEIFKQFSLDFIPVAVSTVEKSFSTLSNFDTVVILSVGKNTSLFKAVEQKFQENLYPPNWIFIIQGLYFKPFFIPHDVKFLSIEIQFSDHIWKVHRIYSVTQSDIFKKLVGFGNANSNNLYMKMPSVTLPKLMNKQIRVTTISFEPYFSAEKLQPQNGGKSTGLYGEVLGTLESIINFSFVVEQPETEEFGVITSNNQVTGILGKLFRNESDIGIALTLTETRMDMIDFSPYLHFIKIKLLYHQIYETKHTFFFYFTPFCPYSWICIIMLTVFVAILLTLTKNYCNTNNLTMMTKCKKSLQIFMAYLYKMVFTLLRTGESVPVYGFSAHIIIQFFHLFCLLIYINYSSTLTSMLAVSKYSKPFKSLDELVFKTDYALTTLKGTSIIEILKTSDKLTFSIAWEKMQQNPKKYLATSNEEALELLANEKAALITESDSITVIMNGNCSFRFAKNDVYATDLRLAYRFGFAYKKLFNKYVLILKESGVLNKINRDNLPEKHNKICKKVNLDLTLKLIKVTGLFYTFIGGILISLFVLSLEICAEKCSKKR